MHVLYLANTRLPTVKAHGVQMMKSCEGFALAGASIRLVAIRRSRDVSAQKLFDFYGITRTFPLALLPIPDSRRLGSIGYRFESLLFMICSVFIALFSQADVIYTRDEKVAWILGCLGFRSMVWESHDRSWNFFARRIMRGVRIRKIVVTSDRLQQFYCFQRSTALAGNYRDTCNRSAGVQFD